MFNNELLRDAIEWDVVNWSKAFEFWQKNTSLDLTKAYALEIGSRHGGLSLWAALQGARVECTDIESPQSVALKKHQKYGVEHKVQYGSLDVLHIPDEEKFDLVLFKSVLGGLGLEKTGSSQSRALDQIFKVLKPGGELFFAENLTASKLHQYFRSKFLHRDKDWRYVTRQEILDWTRKFQSVRLSSHGFAGTFGRNERQRMFLGMLDSYFFNKITPSLWHYVLLGVAKKHE